MDSFYRFLFKMEVTLIFQWCLLCMDIRTQLAACLSSEERGGIPERGRVERSPCLPPGSSCPCLPQPGLWLPCRRRSTNPERDDQTDPPSWHWAAREEAKFSQSQ